MFAEILRQIESQRSNWRKIYELEVNILGRVEQDLQNLPPDVLESIEDVSVTLDRVGFMVVGQEALLEKVLEFIGQTIQGMWDILEAYIIDQRDKPRRAEWVTYFQKLYQRQMERETLKRDTKERTAEGK